MRDREIRTYLSYTYPVDPVNNASIPDIDISYALANTLVELDGKGDAVSGLASKWKIESDLVVTFTLRDNAFWSNGQLISSTDVKRSMDRAKAVYGSQLKSLFGEIEKIETPEKNQVRFHLKTSSQMKAFLVKLTEPMYGIVAVGSEGRLNLAQSSGPFLLESASASELQLRRNPHWYKTADHMAEHVVIKQKPMDLRAELVLEQKPWANITTTSSLLTPALGDKYKSGNYEIWKRNLDRTFWFILGRRHVNEEGYSLLRFLEKSLDRTLLGKHLTGFTLTNQIYPKGTPLYDPEYSCSDQPSELPAVFKIRPLEITMSPDRVSPELEQILKSAIKSAVGIEPHFTKIPLNQIQQAIGQGNYDFYIGSVGAEDPNLDGAMAYYFDGAYASIPSGQRRHDFTGRLQAARKMGDDEKRVKAMRDILRDAVCLGHALPLFHYSTVAIARKELDLSAVPTTDETVAFAKVRFKK